MIKFKKYGPWTDLSIGNFDSQFFLLQGRRRSDGKVQFRVESSKSAYNASNIDLKKLQTLKTE